MKEQISPLVRKLMEEEARLDKLFENSIKYSREDDPAFQDSLYCSADFYEADE